MTNLIYLWSGCVIANQRSREPVEYQPDPTPEDVNLLHSGMDAECTLLLVVEGKTIRYCLNRRMVFGVMAQAAQALQEMEPGKWVDPYEAQTTQEKSA